VTTELSALRKAYEAEKMSPEEIAQDRALDLTAVKAGLMQCSAKYRKDCGKEDETVDELNFNNDDLRRVNKMILDLALGAEDEHLRAKMACYVRDDKKGRKEVIHNIQGSGMNLFFINEQMRKVREIGSVIKQGLLGNSERETINV
jgi:hypothetical protein